jgi:hypothetical protein
MPTVPDRERTVPMPETEGPVRDPDSPYYGLMPRRKGGKVKPRQFGGEVTESAEHHKKEKKLLGELQDMEEKEKVEHRAEGGPYDPGGRRGRNFPEMAGGRGGGYSGGVSPLPVKPGPQAGRPTRVESEEGIARGLPRISPSRTTQEYMDIFGGSDVDYPPGPRGRQHGGPVMASRIGDRKLRDRGPQYPRNAASYMR